MRRFIFEASARVLLVLVVGEVSGAQTSKTNDDAAIAGQAGVHGQPPVAGLQTQQTYLSNSEKGPPDGQSPGYISGTILDQSGAVSAGAEVRLTDETQTVRQEIESGTNGQFLFAKFRGHFVLQSRRQDSQPENSLQLCDRGKPFWSLRSSWQWPGL
jgi:hypothetical protein